MSSTTIIMKALDDLNMRHRRFAPQVLAVLIVEDLIAVILMVLLSSIAINNSVSGEELLWSVMKLSFFLILWYVVASMPYLRSCRANAGFFPTSLCWCFASDCAF